MDNEFNDLPEEAKEFFKKKPTKIIIKRNDLCLCGSGKKFKKCCFSKFYTDFKLPDLDSNCLCGSGLKFKDCCKLFLETKEDYSYSRRLFNDGKYLQALENERALFTEYVMKHKRHLKICLLGYPLDLYLKTDVAVLAEDLAFISQCYMALNRKNDFLDVLDSVSDVIQFKLWNEKILAIKSAYLAFALDQMDLAKTELKKIDSLNKIDDYDLLAVYLHINGDQLSIFESSEICKYIIEKSPCSTMKLKYSFSLGVKLHLMGDNQKALDIMSDALSKFDEKKNLQESVYKEFVLGDCKYFFGVVTKEKKYLLEAVEHFEKSLSSELYNNIGEAEVLSSIASSYFYLKDYCTAKAFFLKSLEKNKSNKVTIDLSRTLLKLEMTDEAKKFLDEIDEDTLSGEEWYDYVLQLADISLFSDNFELAKETYHLLDYLEIKEPYFREIRDEMKQILLLYLSDKDKSALTKLRSLIDKFGTRIWNSLILQPNYHGLGIDLKKLAGREKTKKRI